MKNFTAALLSFYEGVVSCSSQSKTGKNLEVESVHNNRAILFKNISMRNFLWGFYGVFSELLKPSKRQLLSILGDFDNFDKYQDYLTFVIGSKVYPKTGKASVITRCLVGVLVALFALNSNVANAQCSDLGDAKGFAVFTFGDFKSSNDQVWGRVAVGGNLTLSNYGVGAQNCLTNDPNRNDLIVGGNLSYNVGQVNNGSVRYGGTLISAPTVVVGNIAQGNLGITFSNSEIDLKNKSTFWSGLTQTGTVNNDGFGNVALSGTSPSLNVFNLTAAAVQAFSYLNVNINVPSGSTVLINVSGSLTNMPQTTVNYNGSQINTGTVGSNYQTAPQAFILWNLESSTTAFTMNQVGFQGSILAPWANVTSSGGEMNGSFVTNSIVNNNNTNAVQIHCTTFQGCLPTPTTQNPNPTTCSGLGGRVFRDFNLNGIRDNNNEIGLAGVTVKAFNSANSQVGSTVTTATDGTYTITGLSGNVRVEFSNLPAGYVSGPDGSTSGTSVQFVTLSSTVGCAVDFGVNHPDDFCVKSGVQPKIAVPCFANGAYNSTGPNGAGLEDALVSFPYNQTGDKATTGNAPNLLSSYSSIGSVWGMAYNKYNKTLFATAFMKRHSGFGPQGISGLYVVQNADASGLGTVTGINLQTLLGINAGTEPTRNLSADKTQPTDDGGNAIFDAVGKMSFGDCDLSADGNTLYITNLFDKKIYVLNVTNPLSPTLITSYLVPNPACAVGSEYAPFGLKFYRGKLYVGVVCTAESSQPPTAGATYGQTAFDRTTLSSNNLKATVYELNGATFSTALTQFPLNYDRGRSNSDSASYAIWRPWVNSFSQVVNNSGETYPQPILSDIEFDSDGSMILGFADRYSHQLGNSNYPPGQTYTVTGRVEGDIMRATKSGSTWTIENNGTASGTTTSGANKNGGPGGGEYYFGDLTIDHDEPAMGGLALYPGIGEIMTTISGPVNIFYSGGIRRMNNNTGDYLYSGAPTAPNSATWNSVLGYRFAVGSRPAPLGDYKLYDGSSPGTFGKASGLGDIEIFCSIAPLNNKTVMLPMPGSPAS